MNLLFMKSLIPKFFVTTYYNLDDVMNIKSDWEKVSLDHKRGWNNGGLYQL